MSIQWNIVTWYSKLLAVIFFIGVLPVLTFYIGTQYQGVIDAPAPITYTNSIKPKHGNVCIPASNSPSTHVSISN